MALTWNNKASNQERPRNPTLLLALAGLLSALITTSAAYPLGQLHLDFAPGTIFGVLVSGCLVYCGFLHNSLRIIGITIASTTAYFASIMVAGSVELHSPFGKPPGDTDISVSAVALFTGGVVGAFIFLSASSVLLNSRTIWRRQLFKALIWSLLGGVLGIVGWRLGPSLGMAIWEFAHSMALTSPGETFLNALTGQTSRGYSLWVVWQTGMGAVLGLVLRGQENDR